MITIEECISLTPYTTFGVPVSVRFFAEATTFSELAMILNIFKENPLPKVVLGGGSNLLFTEDFNGIVVYPNLIDIVVERFDEDHVWVKAEAGVNWDAFVGLCVQMGWGGIENLSLIPGNVGACPVQNIGAYGVEVKDVIDKVEAIEMATGEVHAFTNDECRFSYRDSIFKHEAKDRYVIVAVTFKLNKHPELKIKYADVEEEVRQLGSLTVENVRRAIIRIRKRKLPDPEHYGNAGSFFKNPIVPQRTYRAIKEAFPEIPSYPAGEGRVKIPAAWLIETAGWKGKREGDVGSYPSQPLVLVNYGKATGAEVLQFAKSIKQSVKEQFDIDLEMEVNVF